MDKCICLRLAERQTFNEPAFLPELQPLFRKALCLQRWLARLNLEVPRDLASQGLQINVRGVDQVPSCHLDHPFSYRRIHIDRISSVTRRAASNQVYDLLE